MFAPVDGVDSCLPLIYEPAIFFKVYTKVPFYLYLANIKKYILLRICSSIYFAQLKKYCLQAFVFIVKELNSAVRLASLSQ
jgi:hypothetical protein